MGELHTMARPETRVSQADFPTGEGSAYNYAPRSALPYSSYYGGAYPYFGYYGGYRISETGHHPSYLNRTGSTPVTEVPKMPAEGDKEQWPYGYGYGYGYGGYGGWGGYGYGLGYAYGRSGYYGGYGSPYYPGYPGYGGRYSCYNQPNSYSDSRSAA